MPERWRTVEADPSVGDERPVFEHFWVTLPSGVPELAPRSRRLPLSALREILRASGDGTPYTQATV